MLDEWVIGPFWGKGTKISALLGGYVMKLKMGLVVTVAGAILMGSLFSGAPVWAAKKEATKAQKQAEVRKTVNETLNRLYKLQPASKGTIEKAAGYAVFSNFGMKIFVAGSGTGKGIAVTMRARKKPS